MSLEIQGLIRDSDSGAILKVLHPVIWKDSRNKALFTNGSTFTCCVYD